MGKKNSDLNKAIVELDKPTVAQLLKSGKCLIDGGRCASIPPPILVCLESGFTSRDVNDTRRCHILEILARHGADVNVRTSKGETPAMVVAMFGFLDCLKTLVKCGADLNLTSPTGDTALTLAAMMGQEACVSYLSRNMQSAMLDHRNNNSKTALMLAVSHPSDGYVQSLRHLIKAGADLNARDKNEYTPLMLALSRNSVNGMLLLLKKGAEFKTISAFGETLITLCMESTKFSHFEIIPFVLYGLDPTRSALDKKCLHVMINSKYKEGVRTLVRTGFPPLDICSVSNVKHLNYVWQCKFKSISSSPLSLAITNLLPDVAKYLVANSFFTRFDITRLCWQPEIRAFLMEQILNGVNTQPANECLEVLDCLSKNPRPLFVLSLIQISTSLSQDLLHRNSGSLDNEPNFICKPSYREKVHPLEIPPKLKRELLHQTPASRIRVNQWSSLPPAW